MTEKGGQKSPFGLLTTLLHIVLVAVAAATAALVIVVPLRFEEQLVFGVVVFAAALVISRFKGRLVSLILIGVSLIVSSRYIYWRYASTVDLEATIELVLGGLLLFAETYAFVVLVLGYVQGCWPLDRKPIPLPVDPALWPTVDLYIPTYNEPLSVVRPTVLAAKAVDWPPDKLKIYILDDGTRDEFRDFAKQAGVGYIVREEHKHAKAGNINHALKLTDGEFISIFDCDHVPTRSFLQLTMGWMVADPEMALVQTPHHFNSPDPFERNLKTFGKVPNEGELFYGLLMRGNDLWDAVFFCGSCAVLRRSALEQIGGVAVETVTEDAHTGLKLHRKGYGAAYINVPMASGLATESLSAHVGQRIRWARGMVQIFRTDNPLWGRGLRLLQRLCYTNAMIHFLYGFPRLLFLIAPLPFLIFGINIFNAAAAMVLVYVLPHLAHSVLTSSRLQGQYRHSFWAEVYEAVLATYIMIPTTLALINPKLGKFNVTSKGGQVERDYFDGKIARPYVLLFLANAVAAGFGIWHLAAATDMDDAVIVNLFWAAYNLIVLGAAIAVAWEARQRRRTNRIDFQLPAMLRRGTGHTYAGTSQDMSLGGARLVMAGSPDVQAGEDVHLSLFLGEDEVTLPGKVVSPDGADLRVEFEELTVEEEMGLARCIYSRADAWNDWYSSHTRDQPMRSWFRIIRHSLSAFPRFLLGRSGGAA